MPNDQHNAKTSLDQLQTEQLRLTAFLAPNERVVEPHWFTELTGTEPETRVSHPSRGVFQETGVVGGLHGLALSVQPGRIDWFLLARREEGTVPQSSWIGLVSETLPVFQSLMTTWLENAPPISRLALGAVLHEPAESREQSYRRLAEFLPHIMISPEESTDFLYQINRPRGSSVINGLQIQRLSKWACALNVLMQIQVAPIGQGQMTRIGEEQISSRIELDMSTDPQFAGPLPPTFLGALFTELVEMAVELATAGDIA